MYNDKVLEIFEKVKNVGVLKGASGIGKVGNITCGDIMHIYITVNDAEIITDAKFKTYGCVAAIASTDVACEMIKGKSLDEALKVTNQQVIEYLGGLPAPKIHCSVLAQEAIAAAVKDYRKRQKKLSNTKNTSTTAKTITKATTITTQKTK